MTSSLDQFAIAADFNLRSNSPKPPIVMVAPAFALQDGSQSRKTASRPFGFFSVTVNTSDENPQKRIEIVRRLFALAFQGIFKLARS
jgi:hypothetical protein